VEIDMYNPIRVATIFMAMTLLLAACDERPQPPPVADPTPAPTVAVDTAFDPEMLLTDWPRVPAAGPAPRSLADVPERQMELRNWLLTGNLDALEAALQELLRVARDSGSDRYANAIFELFGDPAQSLTTALDHWVAQRPGSALALAARGRHHLHRAWEARGAASGHATSAERFAKMREIMPLAQADLEAALSLQPDFALAMADMLAFWQHEATPSTGDTVNPMAVTRARRDFRQHKVARVLDAVARFPDSYAVQYAALPALQHRWGGDINALLRFGLALDPRGRHADFRLLPSAAACHIADEVRLIAKPSDAVTLYRGLLRHYPHEAAPYCLFALALAQGEQDRNADAERSLRRYLELAPQRIYGHTMLAHALLAQEKIDEAKRAIDTGLALRPNSARLLCLRARATLVAEGAEAALPWSERGLAQNPMDTRCLLERSAALNQLGRSDEAAAMAARAMELSRDSEAGFREIGIAQFRDGRFEDAVVAFDRALELDPESAQAWYWRGASLRRMERTQEAMKSLDRAIELSEEQSAYWFERGVVKAYFLRDLKGAERDLTEASLRGPDHATIWFELGGARYRLRDCGFVEALSHYAALCQDQSCPEDRLAWARNQLAPERAGKLCPGAG
jgi:tetratricopeptide (TPR) repeat protein